ncbi:DMT family transporter [Rhizobium sp. FKL33]|uniref:DMT family transporter n=1 Tax=Rhizobium sp. FKL33 TaxID=2562307 RepID=UPI0010BFB129|nr:DMT family transporter [Rhizobium sp. FKL33]
MTNARLPDEFATSSQTGPIAAYGLIGLEIAMLLSWSAGFIGTRFASDHAPISLILLWRSLMSGVLLLPIALYFGPKIRLRDAVEQAVIGAFAMAGYLAGFGLAIGLGVPTALVALITDMLPLAVAILSWPLLGQSLSSKQWLGTALGMSGVVLASAESLSFGSVEIWAYLLPGAGTLALAASTLLQRRFQSRDMPVYQSLCIQCLAAAAAFSIFAYHDGGVAPVLEPEFIGGVLWLVVVATFGAWTLYYVALKKSSPARVTAVLYASPPVTMIWAWAMFGEPMSWMMAAGLIVSLLGIVIVARG